MARRVDAGAYADRALAGEARRAGLDPRDRAQAMRLAYGVVQRRRTLDWLIDDALERSAALEPALRDVLRLGAYELAFSDAVPERAAVDQAVRLARGLGGPARRANARAGLANAVLRRLAREAPGRLRELEAAGGDDPATLALLHSVPDWVATRLTAALGAADARGVLAAANLPAETAVRWNPLRGPRIGLERELPAGARRDPLIPEAYVMDGAFALEDSAAWAHGLVMGQSRASMLAARALDARPRERVLDLCAAPGAKATHLAALTRNGAEIVSVELRPARAEALRALARRLGARVTVIEGDARTVALHGPFDAALVDPPCTGLGVLAARPDARWRRREEAIGPLVELQSALLERALACVRPGGRVVYSVCTLLPEEGEEIVAGALAAGARLDDLRPALPEAAHPRLAGALLTLPHRDRTDGFLVARLRPD
ncbi:MAG: rRNA (cytosine967-C5)-methyltransferase [Miltoncostaeaceae bacterium]|nr:rRNA (cytosine967-C5)-methyltransferase [Miltoncostaeaceae bacterium]